MLFLLALLALQVPPAEQPVASDVTAATVFLRGAQLTREAPSVLIPAGTTDLVFTGLTPDLDPESLQLQGDGAFTVLAVAHRLNYLEPGEPTPEIVTLQERLEALRDSLLAEQAMREVYEQEQALLLENKDLGGSDGVRVEELREAAAFYRAQLTEIKRTLLAINERTRALEEAIEQTQGQLGQLRREGADRRTSEVVATVQADAPTRSTLRLRYVTRAAAWAPRYSIRVEAVGEPLVLAYTADVQQTTGTTWDDVLLTLSTSDPSRRGTAPELEPWFLGFYEPRPVRRQGAPCRVVPGPPVQNPRTVEGRVYDAARNQPLPGANVVVQGTRIGTSTDGNGYYRLDDVPPNARLSVAYIGYQTLAAPATSNRMDFFLAEEVVALEEAVVGAARSMADEVFQTEQQEIDLIPAPAPPPVLQTRRATSVEFAIAVPYTIPPDGRPRTVEVQRLAVPAEYRYYAAPKLEEAAYLTARIPDWEAYDLLSGPANLFLEGTYVGQSFLDVASTSDTLVVSLGQDEGVVVERTKERDFSDRRWFGSRQEETLAFAIAIRNTKPRSIEIVVEDQVPRSTDDRIDVGDVEAPSATVDDETGLVRWRLTIPPDEAETLALRYEVTYPRGRRVILE